MFAKRYRRVYVDEDKLQRLCKEGGIVRVPHDVGRVEVAIKYAREAWMSRVQSPSGPDVARTMGHESAVDVNDNVATIHTIELDFERGPYEIEPLYDTYARIDFPGLTLRGTSPGTHIIGGGIRVTGGKAQGVVLKNLKITDQARAGNINKHDAHGLLVDGGASCLALQCEFLECGGSGVRVCGVGTTAELTDIKSECNSRSGIYTNSGGTVHLRGTTNSVTHNGGYGLEARDEGSRILVSESGEIVNDSRTIDRSSCFATRTCIRKHTKTSYDNGGLNIMEAGGGCVIFDMPGSTT